MRILILSALLLLTACSGAPPETQPKMNIEPASFNDLPGWTSENFQNFAQAFSKSCDQIRKRSGHLNLSDDLNEAGNVDTWNTACQEFARLKNPNSPEEIRAFFEQRFQPWAVSADKKRDGLFTGYYEASLKGSRTKSERYRYPLHARPDDLVMVQLGDFREELKGQRIAGRVVDGSLKPYQSREDIVRGNWPHNDKVLVWVDSAVDAFFVQIQGSGVIELEGGGIMRIGYAGQNGHVYYAIGRELVKRGELDKENVSMQSIRAWLESHPNEADEVMNSNESYVFFEEKAEGATGGSGVTLTAGRSLAIDHSIIPYHIPIWLDAQSPDGSGRLQRLMMAQDTGGAIRGPVRGDVYWGYGERAEALAGAMKSEGRYWFLLPKL
ncbi:MAG: murein transglycosylase A [Alphaproteobacteria bacterium]|nr:murein transglycosylase A [Alphaproteobacteria bacterium]